MVNEAAMSAAERSAAYRVLAEGFTYEGAASGPFLIYGADYNDAFDPSINNDAISLRERSHTEGDQSYLFEELIRFYEFFGLKRDEKAEMPDHLSVELEFMHFLAHLENQVQDQQEALVSVRRAQSDFLTRHLMRLIHGVRNRLNTKSVQCIELVETTFEFINAECAHFKQYAEA